MGRKPKHSQVEKIRIMLTEAFAAADGTQAAEIFGVLFEVMHAQKEKLMPQVVVKEGETDLSMAAFEKLSMLELMQLQGRLNRLAMKKKKEE